MGFSLFRVVSRDSSAMIIQIGSGSVAGGLFKFTDGEKPQLLWQDRRPLAITTTFTLERYQRATDAALREVVTEYAKALPSLSPEARRRPSEALVVFTAPWHLGKANVFSHTQDKGFQVTEHSLEKLTTGSLENLSTLVTAESREHLGEQPVALEQRTVEILLNGYPTQRPIGKRARRVRLVLYQSLVAKEIIATVRSYLASTFHTTPQWGTLPLVAFTALRDYFPYQNDYVIAQVGSQVTELTLVRGGIIQESTSFPLGTAHLVKSLSKRLKTSETEVRSLLRLAAEGSLEKQRAFEFAKHLGNARADVLSSVAKVCSSLGGRFTLPQHLYLLAIPEFSRWFQGVFADAACAPFTSLHDPFTVVPLDHEFFAGLITSKFSHAPDPILSLCALYFNKMRHQERVVDAILKQQ